MKLSILHLSLGALAVVVAFLPACDRESSTQTTEEQSYEERSREFPLEMEPFKLTYFDSALQYNAIEARPGSTRPWESKFLGHPYLPIDTEYPHGKDGKPLRLLAQLNFAEMPRLQDFPSDGIVQFFVSPLISSEQIWGSNQYRGEQYDPDEYFESLMAQDFFRVTYYDGVVEEPKRLQTKSPKIPDGFLPIDQEARLTFSRHIGYVPNDDYRFEKFFKADAVEFFERFGTLAYEVGNQYYQFTQPLAQAWVGGYAVFAQSDPRGIREDEDWVLLLEIDSSNEHGLDILWGDSGVGAFFIRRADLRNKDFSKVLYYWDNH